MIPITALVLALGCAPQTTDTGVSAADDADSGAAGSGEGTLALTFAMDADYIDVMDEAPVGPFWGSLYRTDEVTGVGPDDGAEDLGSVYVEEVDLTAGETATAVLFTTGALPSVEVTLLGFVDSDGNADADSPDPDDGDPVTLPADNSFQVVADAETTVLVYFGFLNP